jgi:orotate phosphoribosyltransferase
MLGGAQESPRPNKAACTTTGLAGPGLQRGRLSHARLAAVTDALTDLARRVSERSRLTGAFTLRSGQTATTYFDKYLFEGDPAILSDIAEQMLPLIPHGTEVLAGLELGGVPVATALSLASGLPVAFVRKEAKRYGTAKLAEGADIVGRQVLVVEDVITTGGQVVLSTAELRELGARVDSVLCVIDRSEGDHTKLDAISLRVVSLFTKGDLDL